MHDAHECFKRACFTLENVLERTIGLQFTRMDQIQLQYMRSSVIIPVGRGMIFEEERKQTQHRHTFESSPHNNGTPCLEALA